MGPVGVGCARTLACSEFGGARQSLWPLTNRPGGRMRTHALQVQRPQGLRFSGLGDDHSLVDAQPWCDPGESEHGSEEAPQLQGRKKQEQSC